MGRGFSDQIQINNFVFSLQETHVIHTFKEDFYGEILSVVLVGYIRPEASFPSLGKIW